MSTESITVHTAKRRAFAKVEHINRLVWLLGGTTVLGIVGIIGIGAYAVQAVKASVEQQKPYVVVLDENFAPVGQRSQAGSMPPGAYVYFAREWVRQLRERPAEKDVGQRQANAIFASTDERLFNQLGATVKEEFDLADGRPVKILEIEPPTFQDPANPIVDGTATLTVYWKQRADNIAAKTKTYRATLKVSYSPGRISNTFNSPNLLGLYAVAFQPTLISES